MSTVHTFTPIVVATPREDGRYDVEFDWSDAYYGGHDPETDPEADQRHPAASDVCAAIDRLRDSMPATYVTPAAVTPAPDVAALLAEYDAWTTSREDLAAAEEEGRPIPSDAWADHDDEGTALTDALAATLRTLTGK